MQQETSTQWPTSLGPDDTLYYVENLDTGSIDYLVFSSYEKRKVFMRASGAWWPVAPDFYNDFDDPSYSIEFVDVDFVPKYDAMEIEDAKNRTKMVPPSQPLVSAASDSSSSVKDCPIATRSISINLKNRRRAISVANYGPLNPELQNKSFWEEKARTWSATAEEAKQSLCGNCSFFIVTAQMKSCIEAGIQSGGSSSDDAWDSVNAGNLGYCDAFDFKCAASRTCDAWVVGGPITDQTSKSKGE